MIEKGIYSEPEFERLRAELERVERRKYLVRIELHFLCLGGEKVKVGSRHLATSSSGRASMLLFVFAGQQPLTWRCDSRLR